MKRPKPKFSAGQVVAYTSGEYVNGVWHRRVTQYGTYEGFDDGMFHIKVGGRDWKVTEVCPLTKKERGGR